MKKRQYNVLSDGGRAPIGRLATATVRARKPLRATDVNVSAVFKKENRYSKRHNTADGSKLLKATAMGGVLEESSTSRVLGARRVRPRLPRSRDESLCTAVALALSKLNTRLQLLKDELNQLVTFDQLVLLSEHELLVLTNCKLLVLHSSTPLKQESVRRFGSMKLALNSQCYYVLYNDVDWCMRWKFF